MSLKCIFRFEALDSTRCLNKRAEYLFKKGVYWGGVVTTDSQQVTNIIYVSPFRLISHDGMYVLSDTSIPLVVGAEGTYYVVCKAKYIIDDSPDISVMLISIDTYNSLTEDEKLEYVIFADVTSDGYGVQINMTVNREEISQLGRNPWRGYFTSEEELEKLQAMVGDVAMVKTNSTIGAELYVFNGVNWIRYGSATDIYEKLVNHQNNNDTKIAHSTPIIEDEDKFNGAYHVNYNQLNSLNELGTDGPVPNPPKQETITTSGKVQVFYLNYKEFRDNISDEDVTIQGFVKKDSIASLTNNSYYVDNKNGLVYVLGTSGSSATIIYSTSYKDRLVVVNNKATELPRSNELEALRGNEYSLTNEVEQVPSDTNRFITSNTKIPELKEVSIPSNQIVEGKYIRLNTGMTVYLRDSDNAIEYFDILNLENNKPSYCYALHVIDNNVRRNLSNNDLTNGWFTTSSNKNLEIEINGFADFVNSSITGSVILRYYGVKNLGSKNVKSFADEIEEPKFRRFHTIKVNTLFSIDNEGYNSSIKDGKLFFKKDSTEFGKIYSSVVSNKNTLNVFGDNVLDLSTDRNVADGTVKVSSNRIEIGDSNTSSIDTLATNTKLSVIGANNKFIELNSNNAYIQHAFVKVNSTDTELNSTNIVKVNNNADTTIASGKVEIGNGHGAVNLYGIKGSELNLDNNISHLKNNKGNEGRSRVSASAASPHNSSEKIYSILDASVGSTNSTYIKTYDTSYKQDYSSVEVQIKNENNTETYSTELHSIVNDNTKESVVRIINESYSSKRKELGGIIINARQNPILDANNVNLKYGIVLLDSIGNENRGDKGVLIASSTVAYDNPNIEDNLKTYIKLNNMSIRLGTTVTGSASNSPFIQMDTDLLNLYTTTTQISTSVFNADCGESAKISSKTISLEQITTGYYHPKAVLTTNRCDFGIVYDTTNNKYTGLTVAYNETTNKQTVSIANSKWGLIEINGSNNPSGTGGNISILYRTEDVNQHTTANSLFVIDEKTMVLSTEAINASIISLGLNASTSSSFNLTATAKNNNTLPKFNILFERLNQESVSIEHNSFAMNGTGGIYLESKLIPSGQTVSHTIGLNILGGYDQTNLNHSERYTVSVVNSSVTGVTEIELRTIHGLSVFLDGYQYYIPLIYGGHPNT